MIQKVFEIGFGSGECDRGGDATHKQNKKCVFDCVCGTNCGADNVKIYRGNDGDCDKERGQCCAHTRNSSKYNDQADGKVPSTDRLHE